MGFNEAMEKLGHGARCSASGKFATRKAYGLALRALGHANPRVYALDADVRNSTFAEWFANDKELADRFVECKIAEQNMISVAAGLSAAGKIPFCSTFAKFVTRALRPDRDGDQLRREPQDRRQPQRHLARRRRAEPDGAARRRVVPQLHDDDGPPRQPGLLRPPAGRRLRRVRPDDRDGRAPRRVLHADDRARTSSSSTTRTPSSTSASSRCSPRDATC